MEERNCFLGRSNSIESEAKRCKGKRYGNAGFRKLRSDSTWQSHLGKKKEQPLFIGGWEPY